MSTQVKEESASDSDSDYDVDAEHGSRRVKKKT